MARERHPRTHPGPPAGMTERRSRYRREEDDEANTIAEGVVKNSSIIASVIRWSKIVTAVSILLVFTAAALNALNIRIIGSSDDVKTLRADMARNDTSIRKEINANNAAIVVMRQSQDSIVTLLTRMNERMQRQEIIQCITAPSSIKSSVCK